MIYIGLISGIIPRDTNMRLSRLRWSILLQLAKAWRLGLSVPVGRIIRVFNFNSLMVYRFLRELEEDGLAEERGRGSWGLSGSRRARVLAEYVLESAGGGVHEYWARHVPEVYYYIAEPPSIEWLGYPGETLVVADECLRGRLKPPRGYRVVYTSMRGRRWRYEWSLGYSRGLPEQSIADLLSYNPSYPVEQYILSSIDWLDINEVARRASIEGLKRLSTFLSFLRLSTGKPLPAGFNYLALLDPGVLDKRLGEYVTLVFANNIAEERGL